MVPATDGYSYNNGGTCSTLIISGIVDMWDSVPDMSTLAKDAQIQTRSDVLRKTAQHARSKWNNEPALVSAKYNNDAFWPSSKRKDPISPCFDDSFTGFFKWRLPTEYDPITRTCGQKKKINQNNLYMTIEKHENLWVSVGIESYVVTGIGS